MWIPLKMRCNARRLVIAIVIWAVFLCHHSYRWCIVNLVPDPDRTCFDGGWRKIYECSMHFLLQNSLGNAFPTTLAAPLMFQNLDCALLCSSHSPYPSYTNNQRRALVICNTTPFIVLNEVFCMRSTSSFHCNSYPYIIINRRLHCFACGRMRVHSYISSHFISQFLDAAHTNTLKTTPINYYYKI